MRKPLRLLIVEDNPDDALLLVRELQKGGFEPAFERVDTREAMEAALDRQTWDVILADHSMPHFSSFAALELMKERKLDVPFIIVSGSMSEGEVVKALKAGAHDYIVKGGFLRLVPAIERELQEVQVRREREEAEQARREGQRQLEHLASHDALTDLPNRLLFEEHLRNALQCRRRRGGGSVAVHLLDLDDFKRVNDTLGHAAGDEVLRKVADRLRYCLRGGDIVSRFGGDEFGVIQSDVQRAEEAAGLARKVCQTFAAPLHINGHEVNVSISAGITLAPADGTVGEQLLKNADLALYQAKKEGRNTFRFFTAELNARLQKQVALERDLRKAVTNDELILYFQPQVDLRTGWAIGMEALVRWQHPERGLLPPAEFVAIAEDSGLIVPLTARVLQEACRQQRLWREAGYTPCRVAVNVSPSHLHRNDLLHTVDSALKRTGTDPEHLEIEITEDLLLNDVEKATQTLKALHELGVSIAIDDFGTGYSSLSYLQQLPVNRLKIDRSFVSRLNGKARESSVIDAIITLGHKLGMRVLAEGVENPYQAEYLADQGCDEVQGNFYLRAGPAEKVTAWLQKSGGARQRSGGAAAVRRANVAGVVQSE